MDKNYLYFFRVFFKRIKEHDISAWAAKLTFFLLLSLFPFLIFLIEILNQISIYNIDALYNFTQFLPPEVISIFTLIIEDISQVKTSSSVLPLAILATIWSASKGILTIISSLNIAYDIKETRSYFHLRFLSLLYTIGFAVITLITLSLIVFGSKLLGLVFLSLPILSEWAYTLDIMRFIFSLILSLLFFILIYNATPNQRIRIKNVLPGAIFATVSWIITSYFFSIYVNTSKNLSYMYGSLTGIIILLLWLYISCYIIMLGGEINALISKRKK